MDIYTYKILVAASVALFCVFFGFGSMLYNCSRSYKEEIKYTLQLWQERSRRVTYKRVLPEFKWWLR